jgi:hypothetical protein
VTLSTGGAIGRHDERHDTVISTTARGSNRKSRSDRVILPSPVRSASPMR